MPKGNSGGKRNRGRFATAKREGFGDYNKDNVPVYNGKIDYSGDFSNAKLKNLTDKEITNAIDKQAEMYREALNENLGDQRTRNGRMAKIFNTARKQQYEGSLTKLTQEADRRNMPKYNIYNKKNNMLLVSAYTKTSATRNLAEMKRTDSALQKQYNWSELPEYVVRREKRK